MKGSYGSIADTAQSDRLPCLMLAGRWAEASSIDTTYDGPSRPEVARSKVTASQLSDPKLPVAICLIGQ